MFSCFASHLDVEGNRLAFEGIETPVPGRFQPAPEPNRMTLPLVRFFFNSLLFCAFSAAAGVCAQKAKPSPTPPPVIADQGQEPAVRIPIRRVRLPITVVDKKGQFVPGLTQKDFLVLEDKVPQQIETFSDDLSQTSPLYVAMLMDTSPSTAGKLKFEQESAMNFIQTVVRPRKDRVLFGTFDDEITLLQDFTDKLDLLDRAVFGVKKMGKQTALFDAVWQFCDEKMRSAPGRRVLVLVTDGEDTYSRASIRDAIDIAQRTETTIFAISTKAGFLTGDMLSLERSFTKISKELRAQYLVTYKPTNDRYDGSFRKIDVKLAERKGDLKVRTKHGYKAIADSVAP